MAALALKPVSGWDNSHHKMTVQDTQRGQQATHYRNLAGTGTGPVLCPGVGPALGLCHVSCSQPALLLSAAWDAGCPGIGHSWARWKVKLPTPDPLRNFLCSNPQLTSLHRTKTLGSEVLSSPVFKGRSVHCTPQDAGRAYFKDSPLLLRWKGHEYQSLLNSKGCFILNREVKCLRLFSAANSLSWVSEMLTVITDTLTIIIWTTAPTAWDQGSSHKPCKAGP